MPHTPPRQIESIRGGTHPKKVEIPYTVAHYNAYLKVKGPSVGYDCSKHRP